MAIELETTSLAGVREQINANLSALFGRSRLPNLHILTADNHEQDEFVAWVVFSPPTPTTSSASTASARATTPSSSSEKNHDHQRGNDDDYDDVYEPVIQGPSAPTCATALIRLLEVTSALVGMKFQQRFDAFSERPSTILFGRPEDAGSKGASAGAMERAWAGFLEPAATAALPDVPAATAIAPTGARGWDQPAIKAPPSQGTKQLSLLEKLERFENGEVSWFAGSDGYESDAREEVEEGNDGDDEHDSESHYPEDEDENEYNDDGSSGNGEGEEKEEEALQLDAFPRPPEPLKLTWRSLDEFPPAIPDGVYRVHNEDDEEEEKLLKGVPDSKRIGRAVEMGKLPAPGLDGMVRLQKTLCVVQF